MFWILLLFTQQINRTAKRDVATIIKIKPPTAPPIKPAVPWLLSDGWNASNCMSPTATH